MKTRNKYAGRIWCMAVVGVTVVALHAYGQARAVNPNGRVNRKDKIETKAPSVRQMLATGVTRSARAAVEYIDEDAPVITVYSEQSKQSGRVASGSTQTYVYRYNQLWPYGIFYNYNSTTSDLTTIQGVFLADNLTFGNGFVGGMTISGYELYVYRSSLDPQPGLADVHVELWDGDPFQVYDTPAHGYSGAVISGTEADFLNIPYNTHLWLTAEFDPEIVIPNERVWMVITSNACQLGWHVDWGKPLIVSDAPADVWQDQRDVDGSFNGLGTCCDGSGACDCDGADNVPGNADDDPCPEFEGFDDDDGQRQWCSDGDAEHGTLGSWGGPCTGDPTDKCSTFVADVFATTDVVVSLLPVAADTKDTTSSSEWTITDNEITMAQGSRPVWLEWYISDWDPPPWTCTGGPNDGQPCTSDDDCPPSDPLHPWEAWCRCLLKAWQIALDTSGYYSGLEGTLAPYEYACTSHAHCPPILGSGSRCKWSDFCEFALLDTSRSDYIFYHPDAFEELPHPEYYPSWGAVIQEGDPIPSPGRLSYAGTLVLWVPEGAKGTFTIPIEPLPDTNLLDQNNQFMPLLGTVPAKITVEVGQCCFGLGIKGKLGCVDNITVGQCADAGLCHGTCRTSGDLCLTDDDCPPGETCSGACSDDGSLCWTNNDCTAGATCEFTAGDACLPDKDLDCPVGQNCVVQGDYIFSPGVTCFDPPCFGCGSCVNDSSCDDGDACTDEHCDLEVTCGCVRTTLYDPETECCNHSTGETVTISDGNPCTDDYCDPSTGEVTHDMRPCTEDADCTPGLCIFNRCVCTWDESCCLTDDTCLAIPAQLCAEQEGSVVDACLGDSDRDGFDDACKPPYMRNCCLFDGSCVEITVQDCAAQGGYVVDACLGDNDGDGRDDACGPPDIPVVSAWGLLITLLLLAVLGKVYFGRRRGACSTSCLRS